jgi:hypothetical protein
VPVLDARKRMSLYYTQYQPMPMLIKTELNQIKYFYGCDGILCTDGLPSRPWKIKDMGILSKIPSYEFVYSDFTKKTESKDVTSTAKAKFDVLPASIYKPKSCSISLHLEWTDVTDILETPSSNSSAFLVISLHDLKFRGFIMSMAAQTQKITNPA